MSHILFNKLPANYRNFRGMWSKFLLHKLQQWEPQNFIQDWGQGSHLQEGKFAAAKLSHNFQFSSVTDEESHTSLPFGLDLNTQKRGKGKGPRTACPEWESDLPWAPPFHPEASIHHITGWSSFTSASYRHNFTISLVIVMTFVLKIQAQYCQVPI